MRQRGVKNLDERIRLNSTFRVEDPKAMKGRWQAAFGNGNPVYLEIGSGKGKFITDMATARPDANFIAVEGQDVIALRLLEKAEEMKLANLRVFIDLVRDVSEYFDEGEIAGIYLNFSDPWPKARHAKRRLTYRENLKLYGKILKDGGFVEFKTDNNDLFDFTLEEIEGAGLKAAAVTRDLHNTDFPQKEITTEYEEKFKAMGQKINFVRVEF